MCSFLENWLPKVLGDYLIPLSEPALVTQNDCHEASQLSRLGEDTESSQKPDTSAVRKSLSQFLSWFISGASSFLTD